MNVDVTYDSGAHENFDISDYHRKTLMLILMALETKEVKQN